MRLTPRRPTRGELTHRDSPHWYGDSNGLRVESSLEHYDGRGTVWVLHMSKVGAKPVSDQEALLACVAFEMESAVELSPLYGHDRVFAMPVREEPAPNLLAPPEVPKPTTCVRLGRSSAAQILGHLQWLRGKATQIEQDWRRGGYAQANIIRDEALPKIDKAIQLLTNDQGPDLLERELRREIEVLRLYGNKDCTASADTRLQEERSAIPQ